MTDLAGVLRAIARTAAQLCEANDALIYLVEAHHHRLVAKHGTIPQPQRIGDTHPIRRDTPLGRAVLDCRPVHVADITRARRRFAGLSALQLRVRGVRTVLAMPLMHDGVAVGGMVIRRMRVRPFVPRQIALLKTFADQAAIAIENARLSDSLDARNRAMMEALEQQTATGEILRVISRSPTDTQPVFETIIRNAVRLSGAAWGLVTRVDGALVDFVAHHNLGVDVLARMRRIWPHPVDGPGPTSRVVASGQVFRAADVEAEDCGLSAEALTDLRHRGIRSMLVVPMFRDRKVVGTINLTHQAVGAFSDSHVALMTTFADQAVIAIENARLFRELEDKNRALTEALEQQTATAEILRAISRSPTDLQPVFDTIVQSAVRLCKASTAGLFRVDGGVLYHDANAGGTPEALAAARARYPRPLDTGTAPGIAILTRTVVQVPDAEDPSAPEHVRLVGRLLDFRSVTTVPMLRGAEAIGAIAVTRREPGRFSDTEVELLKTFSDQAIIAIENVRLFAELERRNRALTEALEQQTATADILRVISQSPTDLGPVLRAVAEHAARLCDATDAQIYRLEDDGILRRVASYGSMPTTRLRQGRAPGRGWVTGRAVADGRTIRVVDLAVEVDTEFPEVRADQAAQGTRSAVATPLLREGRAVGAILIRRTEVRPFSDTQVHVLETFASQAVIAIENVRLFTELEARTRELTHSVEQLTALGEVGQAVSSTLDLETVLTTIASRAAELAATDTCTVFEYDEAREEFHLRATHNVDERVLELTRVRPIRKGEGVTGRVADTHAPVQVEDVAHEHAYQGRLREALLAAGVRSVLAIPLLREDRLIGVLIVTRNTPGRFADEITALLQTFATQSAIAIQNARLYRELEAKGRELEAASRHKSQFLANMSHELRTPMNAILGYTELIADGIYGGVPEPMREVLGRVEVSGRHLLGLINDVLDLSKIEAGQLTLTLADYTMKEVVDAVVAAVEALAAEKHLRLLVDLAPDLPTGRGDQRRLAQVLLNLVGNAIKFTERGEISVRVGAAAGLFTVAVSDTGPGIAPADQERIFEEFQQADTSTTRPKGGTGLGLAIARRIVAMHGGRMWVESVVGAGATFRFTMPIRVEQPLVIRAGAA